MASAYKVEKEIYGCKTLFREIGYYISRLEQYERALPFFDQAVKKTPSDRRALMGRAWARSKACKYEEALEDIKKSLKVVDPNDLPMLAIKALNTYLNCEFEDGLVQNTRLIPKRKKPDYFAMGAMHCANAIENCLGERAGRPLRDHYLIIRRLAWKKNFVEPFQPSSRPKKKKKRSVLLNVGNKGLNVDNLNLSALEEKESQESVADTIYSEKSEKNIVPPRQSFPYRPLQRYTTNIQNYMAEKYLDSLYKDKLFLKTLSKQPGIISPNVKGTEKILQLAKTGYKTVKYKQELLRARRPFYFIKYQEVASSGGLKARQEQELKKLIESTKGEATHIEDKMAKALADKDWKSVLYHAEKLKQFCDSKPKKILPNRDRFFMSLYDKVCQAHFDLKRLNPSKMPWDHERRILKMLGLPTSRNPSKDSVVKQLDGIRDIKKETALCTERLTKASSPQELCWLYYELSRNFNDQKQYELSRVYAKRCIAEARRLNENRWLINALFELVRTNAQQRSKTEAKSDLQQAVALAKKMDDDELVTFMTMCGEVVEKYEFDGLSNVMQMRETKILDMMTGDDTMKAEASHFFRKMSTMPAARRMSMMPGVPVEESGSIKPSPLSSGDTEVENKQDKK